MVESRTIDQLKEMVEHRLDRACFVEIHPDATLAWRAFIVSGLPRRQELQDHADLIFQELRKQFRLKIRRTDAQAMVRDELRHPAAFVQIIGNLPATYHVEVKGADANAQRTAERIFERLDVASVRWANPARKGCLCDKMRNISSSSHSSS